MSRISPKFFRLECLMKNNVQKCWKIMLHGASASSAPIKQIYSLVYSIRCLTYMRYGVYLETKKRSGSWIFKVFFYLVSIVILQFLVLEPIKLHLALFSVPNWTPVSPGDPYKELIGPQWATLNLSDPNGVPSAPLSRSKPQCDL